MNLFSFHVMKENYRKAAHVMFECGSRLGLELVTVVGLKKQVSLTPSNNEKLLILEHYYSMSGASLFGDYQLSPPGQPKVSMDRPTRPFFKLRGVA